MRGLFWGAFSLVFLLTAPAAQASELYRCEVRDSATTINGVMARDASTALNIQDLNPVIVDTSTGVIRVGVGAGRVTWRFEVQQKGSPDSDFVAAPVLGYGSFIALRVWQSPVQMLLTENHMGVVTGVCAPLG